MFFLCACLLSCKFFFMVFLFLSCFLMRFLHLSNQYSLCAEYP